MSDKPINHGFDHRPGGTDPIPNVDHLIWPRLPLWFDLTWEDKYGGAISIDTTRQHNYKFSHAGSITQMAIVRLFPLSPGAYELVMNSQAGPGYGSFDLYVAGAYPFAVAPTAPIAASSDWIHVVSYDFSSDPGAGCIPYTIPITYHPESRDPSAYGCATGGYNGTGSIANWTVDFAATDEGLANLYKKSTAIDTSSNLNGGAGYYWVRLDLTGTFELSNLFLDVT